MDNNTKNLQDAQRKLQFFETTLQFSVNCEKTHNSNYTVLSLLAVYNCSRSFQQAINRLVRSYILIRVKNSKEMIYEVG